MPHGIDTMLFKLAVAALAVDLLAGCADQSSDPVPASVPEFNVGAASGALADGMTLAAVHTGRPGDTSETSCGKDVGQPWTCRIEHYYGDFRVLQVVYHEGDDGWIVNGWDVY